MRTKVLVLGVCGAGLLALATRALIPVDRTRPTGGWMAAQGLTPQFEEVAGIRVRYVRTGRGPTVLLLHGFSQSIFTWRHIIPTLARDHDVVALDFPGFGGSDQPADVRAEIYPTVMAGFVDRLGIRRTSVVGNCLGGTMAVLFSVFRPDRLDRLVLLNPSGFRMKLVDQPAILRLGATRPAMGLAEQLKLQRPLVRMGLRQLLFDEARLTDEAVEEYVAPLTRPGALPAIHSLLTTYTISPEQFGSLVRRVKADTLIVWGRQDVWMPIGHAERYARGIPSARLRFLDGCGHLPQEEKPEEVAALLQEFLRVQPGTETARSGIADQPSAVPLLRAQAISGRP